MKKYLTIIFIAGIFQSCVTYNHTNRISKIESPETLELKDTYVVDVKIDLDKKVTAISENHPSKKDAMNEAYYNCIIANNIDIIIDPIYKSTHVYTPILRFILPRVFVKYRYEVHGYAGYYTNPESRQSWENKKAKTIARQTISNEKSKLAEAKLTMKIEEVIFETRGKNLNTLAKIGPSAKESKSSYMIETVEGCCGDNKNNVVNVNSSGNGFGDVHLLHTTDNSSSLVKEYKNLVCLDCVDNIDDQKNIENNTFTKSNESNSSSDSDQIKLTVSKGFFKKLFGK
jgi:hypothetical protein